MMRKEAKKLSLARGIDLPAIQLNDVRMQMDRNQLRKTRNYRSQQSASLATAMEVIRNNIDEEKVSAIFHQSGSNNRATLNVDLNPQ
jgi:hypothetical protein